MFLVEKRQKRIELLLDQFLQRKRLYLVIAVVAAAPVDSIVVAVVVEAKKMLL